jgi:hypothetical protein
MSIIHSALRKVQEKRFSSWEKKEIADPFKDLNLELESLQTKAIEKYYAKKKKGRLFAGLINCVGILACIGGLYALYASPLKDLSLRYLAAFAAVSTGGDQVLQSSAHSVSDASGDSVIRSITPLNNQDISHILPLAEIFPELVDDFICTGIIFDKSDPSCIINDYILRVGDMINGARILHIDPQVVIFLRERKLFSMTVL